MRNIAFFVCVGRGLNWFVYQSELKMLCKF